MKMNFQEIESAKILIDLAIKEDVGSGDVTTDHLIPEGIQKKADMRAKSQGIIAGLEVAELVFRHFDSQLEWNPLVTDGDKVQKGDVIVNFSADYRALLTGERTALNFLQRLSGIATISSYYVSLVKGTGVKILDTRKTLPGFRLLDKYAVKAGGAHNHRMGLYDMVMIKDNHISVAGGILNAVKAIRSRVGKNMLIEVETACLEEVNEALTAGADIIMLDNMDDNTMREAVKMIGGKAMTEASGNMTPERLAEAASTGVNFISVGALTHSVKAMDISQTIFTD
jgi:nicotinate-nucleotide pyrophosphorylase (carboxylating)